MSVAKKLLDDMQNNHSQWHVERTSKRVSSITEVNNEELTSKVDELLSLVKGKEDTQVNAIATDVNDINFIARTPFNPTWKNNYASNVQKYHANPTGAPYNNYDNTNGANHGNLPFGKTVRTFMQAQTKQNNMLIKITENHESSIGKLSNQAVARTSTHLLR